ncbi:hypothetical protein GCM10009647_023170 [Streptomyces sanglieri]
MPVASDFRAHFCPADLAIASVSAADAVGANARTTPNIAANAAVQLITLRNNFPCLPDMYKRPGIISRSLSPAPRLLYALAAHSAQSSFPPCPGSPPRIGYAPQDSA